MTARAVARLSSLAVFLGTLAGCNWLPGVPVLSAPENLARMQARFKATIAAELPADAQPDWGTDGRNFWNTGHGPDIVVFCGRPVNAAPGQRTYQINYYRGYFLVGIDEAEMVTPAHPISRQDYDECGALDKERQKVPYPSMYDLGMPGAPRARQCGEHCHPANRTPLTRTKICVSSVQQATVVLTHARLLAASGSCWMA